MQKPTVNAEELIDMQTALKMLKTSRPTFYRWLRSGKIKGMKIGRQWRFYPQDIKRFLAGQSPQIELSADISPLQEILSKALKDAGKPVPEGKTPVESVALSMIYLGYISKASDIHITSHLSESETEPVVSLRYRIDGVLHQAAEFDIRLLPPIIGEWKKMAGCNFHENRMPQDGRLKINMKKLNDNEPEEIIDIRASFLPAALGESVTVRILYKQGIGFKLKDLPYSDSNRKKILKAIKSPFGVIYCCGPTGSGKTTTLYSCLNELCSPERKILSVEDPVEYILPWVTQVAVNQNSGMGFSQATRALLRSDPDVIMVGELRTLDSLNMCIQSALTGHLVLTSLHTNGVASTITRLKDIGAEPFLIAETTTMIINQRLVRKLCKHCRKSYKPPQDIIDRIKNAAIAGGLDWESIPKNFMQATGCKHCFNSGYRGRTVISEVMMMTPDTAKAIRNNLPQEELHKLMVQEGMLSLVADGASLAAKREITIESLLKYIG